MVREFYANFSTAEQDAVFFRGVKIPFTEHAIRRHLGIRIDLLDPGVEDAFEVVFKMYKERNLNMEDVFRIIEEIDTVPNPLDHAILNVHASAWQKVIMANIYPKSHGTTFDMSHALLIYVFMTEGVVSLPCIMRNILLTRPLKHSHHLLPYPAFISRLASECRVPEYPGDEFYMVREVEIYCPYGDWKGERPRIRRGRLVPPRYPPQDQQEEQQQPVEASTAPSTSAQYSLEPSLHEVMRRLDRQERLLLRQSRQIANTQLMIRQTFPEIDFTSLERISSDDSSENAEF
ncbi:hypothetical protein PIB30_087162 [Stylosanthes scabra]|uniref:Putative plant transposon protein domain-containing protein n=1 Tax=Stylosanthes scabra TaxID=79078 RepID=A0ABU6XTY8_9FABA|nr:hypothetical protein [Stylosanthes scabra]